MKTDKGYTYNVPVYFFFFAFIFTCCVVIRLMFCYCLYALLCMKYYFFWLSFKLFISFMFCNQHIIVPVLLLTLDYTHISSKPMMTKLPLLHIQGPYL